MLTYEEVSEVLDYDPETGLLKWNECAHHTVRGKIAGSVNKDGYVDLRCKGKRMYGHRVAWLLTHKEWPKKHIDHINGIKTDNRIVNLRVVTNQQNRKNMKRHKGNSSGVTGVYWSNRAKKWQAYICVNYKQIYLGVFKYLVDAETARKEAEIEYGFHKNHGRLP
jgi:hypothetical protein